MNFFGMLGQIGRFLPGYIEGREKAIDENWQDLSNFNQVRHGQLRNVYDIATMEPQISNAWNLGSLNALAAMQGLGNFAQWQQTLPLQIQNAIPLYQQQLQQQQYLSTLLPQIVQRVFSPQQPMQPPMQQPTSTAIDPKTMLNQP